MKTTKPDESLDPPRATCLACRKTVALERDDHDGGSVWCLPDGGWFFDDDVADAEGHEAAFCSQKCRRSIEPDPVVKAQRFLDEVNAACARGLPPGEALRWAAASGHLAALLKQVRRYRVVLEEIADRDVGSEINDNRFAGDVLKENEP